MLKKASALFFCLCFSLLLLAQDENEIILYQKWAENSFRDGDYEFALENYLYLYEIDKQNVDLNYKIGICYTETTIDKSKALPYLEFVVSHNNYPIKSFYFEYFQCILRSFFCNCSDGQSIYCSYSSCNLLYIRTFVPFSSIRSRS